MFKKEQSDRSFQMHPHALGGEPENGAPKWVRHSSSPWKHCCVISLCLIPTLAPWYWDFYLSPWNSPGLWNTGPNPSLRGMVPGNASSYYFLQNTTDAVLDSLTPLLGFLESPPMLTIVCKSLSQDILGNPAKVWSLAKPSITLFFARRPSVFPYPTTSISTVPICHENFPDPSHILAFPLWIPQSTQLNIFLMPLIFCKF